MIPAICEQVLSETFPMEGQQAGEILVGPEIWKSLIIRFAL